MAQRAKVNSTKDISALCTYCGSPIPAPELKVMVGRRNKGLKNTYFEEKHFFIGAEQLHAWIEILFFDAMAKEELRMDLQALR